MTKKDPLDVLVNIIDKALNARIESSIDFSFKQLDLIKELNIFCVNQVLNDVEVLRDPRKIIYRTNQELHFALVALALSRTLVNPLSKKSYNKEFLETNISIATGNYKNKIIHYGEIDEEEASAYIYPEIVYDWMLYRDKHGRGINALMDTKTHLNRIESYQRGGDPQYEFARFERQYAEQKCRKESQEKASAQQTFRNAIAHTFATEIAKKQIIEGKDPMEFMNMLFASEDYNQSIKYLTGSTEGNETATKLLEYTKEKEKKIREH